MDAIRPDFTLNSVTVSAHEDQTGTTSNWSVFAYAVCATPMSGLERILMSSPLESDELGRATATCPAGKNLLGAGALISPALGEVVLDDIRPDAALASVTATGIENESGVAFNWTVSATGLCANP